MRSTQQAGIRADIEERDGEARFEMLARAAALYGYEFGKQALALSPQTRSWPDTTYQRARYRVSVTYAGGIGVIRSTGYVVDATGTTLTYKVVSRIKRELELAGSAPLFMQFALLAHDDLTLSGSILVDTFRVEGDTRAPANANIHTNGTLKVNGGAALVRGFGTYGVSKQVGQETRVFRPYSNPTQASVLSRTTAVPLPTFTPQGLASTLGTDRTSSSDVTLSGVQDFTALGATRDDPYVWYVNGNVTVQSGARLKGYVLFVVNGNLTLSGGETIGLDNGFSESNAAWYTSGNITFKGNSEVWGQFYTGGNIAFSGTPRIYGSVTARATATISGNPSIYYVAGSPALTTYWQPAIVRLRRLSYSEGW